MAEIDRQQQFDAWIKGDTLKAQLVELDIDKRYCLQYDGVLSERQIARIKVTWRKFLEDKTELLVLDHGAKLIWLEDADSIR